VHVIKRNVEQNWVSAIRAHAAESSQVDDGQLQQLQNSACCWHSKGRLSMRVWCGTWDRRAFFFYHVSHILVCIFL